MIAGIFRLVRKLIANLIVVFVCAGMVFVGYKANQPMNVDGAPKGMTYVEFMRDRMEAAKTVEPARCGWGMMLSLATLGPIYSVVYTEVAIHPNGFLSSITAPDPTIPVGVADVRWYDVPTIWWNVVERLSWKMLGERQHFGCKFRPVDIRQPAINAISK